MQDRGLDVLRIALGQLLEGRLEPLGALGVRELVVVPVELGERLDIFAFPLGLEPGLACGLQRRFALGQQLGIEVERPAEGVVQHAHGADAVGDAASRVRLERALERRLVPFPVE